ncbi:MAG: hypothetical protein JO001_26830 [Alphaproteobacteria bacterium]|nr:hypothetical protein [Alphaproteobacteria bacterium]
MSTFLFNIGGFVFVVGASGLIGFRVRSRGRKFLALLCLVTVATIAGALLLSASTDKRPDAEAVLFIAIFAVAPLLACATIGFATGAMLARAPTVKPPDAAALEAAAPPEPAAWCVRHIGFERDGFILDGIDIWAVPWGRASGSVLLPHPAYPAQQHAYSIYEAGGQANGSIFAAGELSNGVWGFYTPRAAAHRPENTAHTTVHLSADGSLRVELAQVEWSNTHWVASPRVTELATGRIVLDLWNTDWDAEVSFPGERCVSLDLRRYSGLRGVRAFLDLANERFLISFADQRSSLDGALSGVSLALEGIPSETRPVVHPPVRRRSGAREWRNAAFILAGALAAIAVLTLITLQLSSPAVQTLTPLPVMGR